MKINNFFPQVTLNRKRRYSLYRDLIRKEAKIGGQLFGTVPDNHRREFFCLDQRTWVWHEEWYDNSGQLQTKTTRYEIQPDRVLKIQNGQYYALDKDEARNLYQAAQLYVQRVTTELYPQFA